LFTDDFDYELPEYAIAQHPATPRESARLLDCRTLEDRRFSDLPEMLVPGDLVVVNNTRVRSARLRGSKEDTGGAVEVLLLAEHGDGGWEVLLRPARRIRKGTRLRFGRTAAVVAGDPVEGRAVLHFDGDVEQLAREIGHVPLPPYITAQLSDPTEYQTVFAERVGSAAAPTAGLHFSRAVLDRLRERGIEVATLDLEVGVDTFRPISTETIEAHTMHSERFDIPPATAEAFDGARERGGRVVAIGTTVVRALESAFDGQGIAPGTASTELFIHPGYRFEAVDAIVTNYHVPRSTLIVLIAAFVGERWREIYETALSRGYRFLSFGDAMYAELF
jgi:S-adenosylmethionine:tRNA ribosyltransferase-isomerase